MVDSGTLKIVGCCRPWRFRGIARTAVSRLVSDLLAASRLGNWDLEVEQSNPPCLPQRSALRWDGFVLERSRLIC